MEEFICKYCLKICKNKNSLALHEIRCKENPNKITVISNFIKYNQKVKDGTVKKLHTNQFTKAEHLGIDKPILTEETRFKIGTAWRGKKHTKEEKEKISNGIRKAIQEHPESYSGVNVNGRVKKHLYNNVMLDGSWEVEVAKYLDKNNIKWIRPLTGFEYEWQGNTHTYFPDFYLVDYDIYIEVKGHQRDRDLYKWKAVENLIIIKKEEIQLIKENTYDIISLL